MRFFDGAGWTAFVSDRGVSGTDPLRVAPGKSPGRLAAVIAVVVVSVLVAVAAVVIKGPWRIHSHATPGHPTSTASPSPAPSASDGTDPAPAAGPGAAASEQPPPGKPALRSAQQVVVTGPVFARGESTYTMAFEGWPFAFRVPGTWECFGGKINLPGAKAWQCIDPEHLANRQRLNIMLRPCPTTCTAAEQKTMSTAWFDPGHRPVVRDATTTYIQIPVNDKGKYSLDTSHFFAGPQGGPLRWQVGAYVDSVPGGKADVEKIINEIRTQSG